MIKTEHQTELNITGIKFDDIIRNIEDAMRIDGFRTLAYSNPFLTKIAIVKLGKR